MTDRPILFSGPMVRALLDGRKTQTRRVLKPQPDERCQSHQLVGTSIATGIPAYEARDVNGIPVNAYPHPKHCVSPYPRLNYAPGDRLWVKETWRGALSFDHLKPSDLPPGAVQWEADGRKAFDDFAPGKLRPSIFMPRWASRITLTVTDVRVERIQDISTDDALAEGILRSWSSGTSSLALIAQGTAIMAFQDLWDSINAKRGFGWDTNPWVVALAFTVHPQNIDRMALS
jgi:hypothetical protein